MALLDPHDLNPTVRVGNCQRKYSNSLWHVDWHKMVDPRWRGLWLYILQDDASRFITGYALHHSVSSKHSAVGLESAILKYNEPASIFTCNNSAFYYNESSSRENGITEFENCLIKHKIRFVVAGTSGHVFDRKIGKLFSLIEKTIKYFSSIEEFVGWYNCVRAHGALGLNTPLQSYYRKSAQPETVVYPLFIEEL